MDIQRIRKRRLRKIIDEQFDGKIASCAAYADISAGVISRYFMDSDNPNSRNIGEKAARKIESALNLDALWLDSIDRPKRDADIIHQTEEPAPQVGRLISINQYHDVHGAMGTGLILPDQNGTITGLSVDKEWISKNVPANTGPHNLRVVTGFGDSMKGMFNSGDPLLVDSGVKEVKFDGVYFFRVGDEGFIKRLQRIPTNGIIVISNNDSYRDWTITGDMDFEVFGRVLKVWNGSEM